MNRGEFSMNKQGSFLLYTIEEIGQLLEELMVTFVKEKTHLTVLGKSIENGAKSHLK